MISGGWGGGEAGGEKVELRTESVPPGLKPVDFAKFSGTAEAVPLSKTAFFSSL